MTGEYELLSRRHANGVIATVLHLRDAGLFVGSASRPGEAHYGSSASSLEHAKALADHDSGCPQPCSCQPWPESSN